MTSGPLVTSLTLSYSPIQTKLAMLRVVAVAVALMLAQTVFADEHDHKVFS